MQRTDIHRPSAPEFDPTMYEFVGAFDLETEDNQEKINQKQFVNSLINKGYLFTASNFGCGHCGARIRYAALMLHEATKGMIYVGETCLQNRFELSKAEFQKLRENAKLNRERSTKKERIASFVTQNPTAQTLIDYVDAHSTGKKSFGYYGSAFLLSLYDQLMRKAELSEKQLASIEPAITRDNEQVTRAKAQDEAKQVLLNAGVRAPEGRVTVVGKILGFKTQESFYGDTVKMIVESVEGWKVYVTAPSGSGEANKGDEVTFTAVLTPSQDDALFAFGKRPTKFAVIKTTEAN